jgi:hypothetical protein
VAIIRSGGTFVVRNWCPVLDARCSGFVMLSFQPKTSAKWKGVTPWHALSNRIEFTAIRKRYVIAVCFFAMRRLNYLRSWSSNWVFKITAPSATLCTLRSNHRRCGSFAAPFGSDLEVTRLDTF